MHECENASDDEPHSINQKLHTKDEESIVVLRILSRSISKPHTIQTILQNNLCLYNAKNLQNDNEKASYKRIRTKQGPL